MMFNRLRVRPKTNAPQYIPTKNDEWIQHFAELVLNNLNGYYDKGEPVWMYRAFCHDLEVWLRKRRHEDPHAYPLQDVWFRRLIRKLYTPVHFVQGWRSLGSASEAWRIMTYKPGKAEQKEPRGPGVNLEQVLPNVSHVVQEHWQSDEHERQPLLIDPYWTTGPQCCDVFIDGEKQTEVFVVDAANHVVWEFIKNEDELRHLIAGEPLPDDVQLYANTALRERKVPGLEVWVHIGNGYSFDVANTRLMRNPAQDDL